MSSTVEADQRTREVCVQERFSLADFECEHGRLPGDPTPACGCFTNETKEN